MGDSRTLAGGLAQAPRSISLIITNGTVVTMDGTRRVLRDGGVAIDGSRIVAVDSATSIAGAYRAQDTIDAQDAVVRDFAHHREGTAFAIAERTER